MKKNSLSKLCEDFAIRFNVAAQLFELRASATKCHCDNMQCDCVEIKDKDCNKLVSFRVYKFLPDENQPLEFEDKEGNKIVVYQSAFGLYVKKTVGDKYYSVTYNESADIFNFVVSDPTSEYPFRHVESKPNGFLITFTDINEVDHDKKYASANWEEEKYMHVGAKKEGENERGFVIYDNMSTYNGQNKYGDPVYKTYIEDLESEHIAQFVNAALKHPQVNSFIWGLLQNMDEVFPGFLEFVKKHSNIEKTLVGKYKPEPFVEVLVEEAGVKDYEITKGRCIQKIN